MPTVCVLSLPLDLSVSDFCEFLGAYLEQVQQMRFLQREGARAPSLVVISFKEQSLADQFFQHFNAKPVRFPRPCPESRLHVSAHEVPRPAWTPAAAADRCLLAVLQLGAFGCVPHRVREGLGDCRGAQ